MMNRYTLYRFLFPFRYRLQDRLERERRHVKLQQFANELGDTRAVDKIGSILWDLLREKAFVEDFRPSADDNLANVFAMGPEEVRDDLVEPLIEGLDLDVSSISFKDFDFDTLRTPKDVANFICTLRGVIRTNGALEVQQ